MSAEVIVAVGSPMPTSFGFENPYMTRNERQMMVVYQLVGSWVVRVDGIFEV